MRGSLVLSFMLFTGALRVASAQPELREVHAHDGPGGRDVYVRGGVTGSTQPLEVWTISSASQPGDQVRVVYSTDGFRSSRTVEATWVHANAGPAGNDTAWRAALGPFPDGTTIEYYVEALGPNGARRAINGHGPEGPAGENFVAYAWGQPKVAPPAPPGSYIEVDIESVKSSQGWLFRNRGRYDPATRHWNGEPLVSSVYWAWWTDKPHWALANDGNHRMFDAVRQGLTRVTVKVVDPPWHVFPARFKFLDSPVYDDADKGKTRSIGVARDFLGADHRQAAAFARRVAAPCASAPPSPVSDAALSQLFEAVRAGALARNGARLEAAGSQAVAERLEAARGELRGLRLELVESADVLAERRAGTVRLSTGLLAALHARAALHAQAEGEVARRALGLILAHEAAHASGLASERLADAEAVRILEAAPGDVRANEAAVRAALEVFRQPVGAARVDGLFQRLRDLLRYGTTAARIERLERALAGEETDPLARWRRADGTLDWRRATAAGALREGGALAHFGLALFLKELATVVATGDRLRMEEFFDGLLSTDFFVHYGLFSVGARAGEVAYGRLLSRHLRGRFVSELLRSNVALATGLALPELAAGRFEGKAFALSFGALGVSSLAVKTVAAGVRGLVPIPAPARGLRAARALSGPVGFVYTAAETAVVLWLAEEIEGRVRAHADERAARDALGSAVRRLFEVARQPGLGSEGLGSEGLGSEGLGSEGLGSERLGSERLAAALEEHRRAWSAWRDRAYAPLLEADARLFARLERFAREAKLESDAAAALAARLSDLPALSAALGERALPGAPGSRRDEALGRRVTEALEVHARERARLLAEVYAPARGSRYLDVPHAAWLARAGLDLTPRPDDPWGGRSDYQARMARVTARQGFLLATKRPSPRRLDTWEDERRVLRLLRLAVAPGLGGQVDEALALVDRTEALDRALVAPDGEGQGEGERPARSETPGLSGALTPR